MLEVLKDPMIKKRDKLMLISMIIIIFYLILAVILIIIEFLLFGKIRHPISDIEIILRIIFSIPYILALIYFMGYLSYAFLIVGSALIIASFRKIRSLHN
jgi:hypothetical protein